MTTAPQDSGMSRDFTINLIDRCRHIKVPAGVCCTAPAKKEYQHAKHTRSLHPAQ
jgi:hypothetical protein